MKTTLDLPDDLMREVKVRAAREGKKMKDLLAAAIRTEPGRRGSRSPALPAPRCR